MTIKLYTDHFYGLGFYIIPEFRYMDGRLSRVVVIRVFNRLIFLAFRLGK